VSRDRILSARGTLSDRSAASVAVDFSRRTITLLLAALVGLAALVFLLMGGGGVSTAYAQEDTQSITAKALTDHGCNSTEWHFVITQIDDEANAPESITVVWANSESEVVDLANFTGGVAHYVTTSNLGSTVVSATAEIYTEWSGQFNLSHGPCGPTETPSGTPSETPSGTPSETPSETPSGTPSETPSGTPSESESPAAVPTEVPAGADAAGGGGSAAGLLGLAVVIGGAGAGTAVLARRRFLHDS
jgi:hypothetical protein